MVDFNELVSRKYAIQQQEADARTTQANAEAGLTKARTLNQPAEGGLIRAQAGLQGAQAAAVPITTQAQAGYYGAMGEHAAAMAGLVGQQTIGEQQLNDPAMAQAHKLAALGQYDWFHSQQRQPGSSGLPSMPPSPLDGVLVAPGQPQSAAPAPAGAAAPVGHTGLTPLTGAPAPNSIEQPTSFGVYDPSKQPRAGFAGGTSNAGDSYDEYLAGLKAQDPNSTQNVVAGMRAKLGGPDGQRPQPKTPVGGYAGGTSKVPGKGPSNVDSVPTNLAPNEAVLNAGGADVLGRPVIDLLNAIGALKMTQAGAPPQQGGMPVPPATPAA